METAVDFSIWSLFARATFIVKIVMVVLVGASFWGWSIIIQKWIAYRITRARYRRFDRRFWSSESLETLFGEIGTNPARGVERIFAAGMIEWRRNHSPGGGLKANTMERVERMMEVAIAKEADVLGRNLSVLATIGSTAPFIGLFGTVWGIMNSFIEIAAQQNSSLTVVAPGIAEALLATGFGLLAAIPAVIFYNKFVASSQAILGDYETFADQVAIILGRQAVS
ncbi:MAG: protein TolQ [Rhodobacteraceae bacterium]|nr:protein TolQ [Paracoccaceae bacterium]